MDPRIFPTVLIVLDLAASAVYLLSGDGDIRRCIYWLAAAVLTATVTY